MIKEKDMSMSPSMRKLVSYAMLGKAMMEGTQMHSQIEKEFQDKKKSIYFPRLKRGDRKPGVHA